MGCPRRYASIGNQKEFTVKNPLLLASLFTLLTLPRFAHAEDALCDPANGFLTPEMRERWCGEKPTQVIMRWPSNAKVVAANRQVASDYEDDYNDSNGWANRQFNQHDDDEDEDGRQYRRRQQGDDDGDEDEQPRRRQAQPKVKPRPQKKPKRPAPPPQEEEQQPQQKDEEQEQPAPPPPPAPKPTKPKPRPVEEPKPEEQSPAREEEGDRGACSMKELTFSADFFRPIPAKGSGLVWGANATEGNAVIDPPFSAAFLSRVKQAHANGIEVFAYLEGPCGDTNGKDDGERARCANLHNKFNRQFAKGTPNTPVARWKPYTMYQLKQTKKYKIEYCEVDNLSNNVTIPLVPFLKDYKKLFDKGEIYCRLVLKNVSATQIQQIVKQVAPEQNQAGFVAPFAIFEADSESPKSGLNAALRRLKGTSSSTIMSVGNWASDHYGQRFSPARFMTCVK